MLWTLIISLILRNRLQDSKSSTDVRLHPDHTPGFCELDTARLEKIAIAMQNKLNSAIAKHDKLTISVTRASQNNKSSQIQHWVFLKQCTAREHVDKSQIKFKIVHQDLTDSRVMLTDPTNRIVNKAYDIAYNQKSLVYKLATLRSK